MPERIHVAVNVSNLAVSERYYTKMLGAEPTQRAQDQIDWVCTSPPIHFSIFSNSSPLGVEHFGLVSDRNELNERISRTENCGADGVAADPDGLRIELYSID